MAVLPLEDDSSSDRGEKSAAGPTPDDDYRAPARGPRNRRVTNHAILVLATFPKDLSLLAKSPSSLGQGAYRRRDSFDVFKGFVRSMLANRAGYS